MPKVSVPKEQLEGYKPVPANVYEVRCDGFSPRKSKKGDSINLQPKLVIINSQDHNDQRLFDNMNTGAWYLADFVHCFGLEMVQNGDSVDIPGEFQGPDNDPSQWTYVGPLSGRVGKVRVIMGQDPNGKDQNRIDQYYCNVPGCQERHSTALNK